MKYQKREKAVLVLEDGKVFHGSAVGAKGTTTGEIAFNTGMTGYQEIFTDPSYLGQIVTMASPHIGNYGVEQSEVESDSVKIAGLVCKKFSEVYSRARSSMSLEDYFIKGGIVGISDVDTRALVRYIRDRGAMNAIISSVNLDTDALLKDLKEVPSMAGLELSSKVTVEESFVSEPVESKDLKVALIDFGVKENIVKCLTERGCTVKVFPMNTSVEEMKTWNPDGFMLSNGPGDPSVMTSSIALVKEVTKADLPVFGICLGHQLLALSQGLSTEKMHKGHRGINHPILNEETQRGEITSQNHGFVVSRKGAESNELIEITHTHLNDNTVAGIKLSEKDIFSVQYHPESSPGPHDSRYLFDNFVTNMLKNK